jgi:hypothetical protein
MNCWGWATWDDRWNYFEKNPKKNMNEWDSETKNAFNLNGYGDFLDQVKMNLNGARETWAVFWYATIFKKSGLCLNPAKSLVKNIGLDGSGENCDSTENYDTTPCTIIDFSFPTSFQESNIARDLITNFYKEKNKGLLLRILLRLKRILK